MTRSPSYTLRDTARITAMVFALVIGGLALAAAGYGWLFAREARQIAQDGVDTLAIVAELTETRRMVQGRPETDFHVRLTFTDRSGAPQTVRREITRDRHAALRKGQEIAITYSASTPTLFTFSDGELTEAVARARLSAWILGLLSLPFFLAWAWFRRPTAS